MIALGLLGRLSVLVVLVLLYGGPAAAALDVRAQYEDQLIKRALRRHDLALEPAPEGQVIEAIVIDASDVILPGDFPLSRWIPWTLANYLHVRTREDVLRRELLFHVGDPYRAELVSESERAMRGSTTGVPDESRILILSVARLVAARGSAPGKVVVLVVTKDQWSLRLNTNFTLDGARIDSLSFSMSEGNVAGRGKYVAVDFALDPGRYLVGLEYLDPRVWGSRHFARVTGGLYLDRQDSHVEGGYATLAIGRPLYTLRTRWSWDARLSYSTQKIRVFNGGTLRDFCLCLDRIEPQLDSRRLGQVDHGLPPFRPQLVAVPYVFGNDDLEGSVYVTRSFGRVNKVNLSAGFELSSARRYLTSEFPAWASPTVTRLYQSFLPRSESSAGPFVTLNGFSARYARLRNINTFALSEDFQIGPQVSLTVHYAIPYLDRVGFSSNFLEVSGTYLHTFLFGDDLLTYGVSLAARLQAGVYAEAAGWQTNQIGILSGTCQDLSFHCLLVNEDLQASVLNVSPRFGPFRLLVHGYLHLRQHDLARTTLTLGNDNGLRGFSARSFLGNNLYLVNAELRTVALNLWTLHFGAVAFYDGGDAPARLFADSPTSRDPIPLAPAAWHQDAGVGLRLLIPQFNRSVLRADLAFPFQKASSGTYQPSLSASFNQAF